MLSELWLKRRFLIWVAPVGRCLNCMSGGGGSAFSTHMPILSRDYLAYAYAYTLRWRNDWRSEKKKKKKVASYSHGVAFPWRALP